MSDETAETEEIEPFYVKISRIERENRRLQKELSSLRAAKFYLEVRTEPSPDFPSGPDFLSGLPVGVLYRIKFTLAEILSLEPPHAP